jgi:hypothetical protein
MTIEVELGLPGRAGDRGAAKNVTSWLAAAAAFAAAVLLRSMLPFNVDVSWWITVSERLLDGQRLYVDILETNPPMAGSVYLVAVALSRAIHVRPEVVTNGLIFFFIAISLALTWLVLRSSSLRDRIADGRLAVWTFVLLTVLPMYDFGQREHLALIAILPALATYVLRGNRERVMPTAILIAGMSAGLTMTFKPYFAFASGFCIMAAATQARDWRILFAPENWIAGALVVINAVSIFVFHPDYFTIIYPLVRDVYLLLAVPFLAIFFTGAFALWLAGNIVVLALQRGSQKRDGASFILLVAAFGFLVSFFTQRKAWGYHAYPMVALALLAAGAAMSAVEDELTKSRQQILAILATAAVFAYGCMWFNGSIDVRQIEAEVARLGPRPKLLVLSAAAVIGHPMVRSLDGTWISRQEAFWVREIVRRAKLDGSIDGETATRLAPYVSQERAGIIEDFRHQPPTVVLVDNHNSDWGDWVRADPELSALLRPYVLVRTIDGIDILYRG